MEFIQQEIPLPCAHPSTDLHSLASDDPLITPITVDWQKEKCALLDFPFIEPIDQHSSMAGQNYKHLRRGYVIQLVLMETVSLGACQR